MDGVYTEPSRAELRRTRATLARPHVRVRFTPTGRKPPEGFHPDSQAYDVRLRVGRKSATFPYYTGPAVLEPDAHDFVSGIAQDARYARDTRNVDEFARELGIRDPKKAKRIYAQVKRIDQQLTRLGLDVEKLSDDERLTDAALIEEELD